MAPDASLSLPLPPPPPGEAVLEWRVANLEADVREIRATTVTHTEFGLRLGNLENMVKEIRDGLSNARNRTVSTLIMPTVSGALVAALVIFMNVWTGK